jgi:integrase
MPTYKQRAAHLALWAHALGRDRQRNTITAADIDAVMQQWLLTPTRPSKGQRGRPSGSTGLGTSTVRKRRTTLQCFFTAMNGKGSHNPVKGTTNPRAPLPELRAIDYDVIDQVIDAMPDRLSAKPGVISPYSLAKVRVRVMAYTGLPPSLIKTIMPSDIRWQEGTLRVRTRHKGRGVEARTIVLTAKGLEALRMFHATNAYGPFTTEALNRSFKRACRQVGLDGTVHLYDLRHSFLTEAYRVTRDLATVARMGMHAPGSPITSRYTQGAHDDVDRAAARALDAAFMQQEQQTIRSAG